MKYIPVCQLIFGHNVLRTASVMREGVFRYPGLC